MLGLALWVAGHFYYCVAEIKLTSHAYMSVAAPSGGPLEETPSGNLVEASNSGTVQMSLTTREYGFSGPSATFDTHDLPPPEDNTATLLNWNGFQLGWNPPDTWLKMGCYMLGCPSWFLMAIAARSPSFLGTLLCLPILPPHTAHRHDDGCSRAWDNYLRD